ncbi:hypothetical protein [Streptomyces sp. NPDC001568]|uniref:hypothetical protein n=1 Tax=Streptomyces sp. NPDC001568 TaxID=3364588 RepID=UPI0036AA4501
MRAALFAALCVLLAATGHLLMSGKPVPWWALALAPAAPAGAGWFLGARERGPLRVTAAAVAVQAWLHAAFSLVQSLTQPVLPAGTPFARQWAQYLTCGGLSAALPSAGAAGGVGAIGSNTSAGADGSGSAMFRMGPGGDMSAAADHLHHPLHDTAHAAYTAYAPSAVQVGAGGHEMAGMSPAGMLTAHLLAAVLCGLWLAHGERAFYRIARCVAARLRAPLRLLLRVVGPAHRPPVPVGRSHRHRSPRRLFLVHAITSRGPPAGTAVL